MKVLITGGSGMVGRALTTNLTADKHEVIILSRSPEWVVGLPPGARAVAWDARTATGWGPLADGADAIVNLAGENLAGSFPFGMRWTKARKERILNSRINAGKAVTEAVQLAKTKPGVVVQASGVNYYGVTRSGDIAEDAPPGDDFLANVCIQWEQASQPVEDHGVRRVVTRSGVILARNEGVLPLFILPFRLFVGGPMGSGKQYVPWIHIEDEVRAIRFLIEQEETRGIYNLAAPEAVQNKDFGKAIGWALSRPSFFPTPAFFFKAAFGETATMILDGLKIIPKRLVDAGFEFKFPQIKPALRDLLGAS
jgi:uncharacterized protein (TIGR01777 family)